MAKFIDRIKGLFGGKKDVHAEEFVIDKNANFSMAEAFNALAVNLTNVIPGGDTKLVCITSAKPGEGKTTVSANVGETLAQNGAKVLLVDIDLRRPSLHKQLGIERGLGLVDVLVCKATIDDVIVNTGTPGLDVITAGTSTPAPIRLLSSVEFDQFIEGVKGRYDWVVFDTSPVNLIADTLVVVPKTEGVVLVVDTTQTDYSNINRVLEAIKGAKGTVLGIVMNKVEQKSREYRSRYDYKYGGYSERVTDSDEE